MKKSFTDRVNLYVETCKKCLCLTNSLIILRTGSKIQMFKWRRDFSATFINEEESQLIAREG